MSDTTCNVKTCERQTESNVCDACVARMRAQESPRHADTVMDGRGPRGW